MISSSKNNTPKLLIKKEFKLKYLSDNYEIIIGKSKNNIIIQSSLYELKLNREDLSILTKAIFNSIDDSFEFIENIFNQKKSYIKDISSEEMKIIIKTFDIIKEKEKEIELNLMKNLDKKNGIIKDLINKFSKMEKEIKELKDDNKKMKKENTQLNQTITNLEMEINTMKKNQNNEMVKLQNQIMNISNMVNQIQLKNNEFKFLKEQINSIENKINLLSRPFQGSISNNQLPFNPINMTLNNNNPNEEQNIMKIAEKKNSLNNSYYEECYNGAITVYFRESGSGKKGPPITVQVYQMIKYVM